MGKTLLLIKHKKLRTSIRKYVRNIRRRDSNPLFPVKPLPHVLYESATTLQHGFCTSWVVSGKARKLLRKQYFDGKLRHNLVSYPILLVNKCVFKSTVNQVHPGISFSVDLVFVFNVNFSQMPFSQFFQYRRRCEYQGCPRIPHHRYLPAILLVSARSSSVDVVSIPIEK